MKAQSHARFLVQAIRDFRSIGAIAPSSPALARLMVDESSLSGAKVVVELGPGGGAFTGPVLAAMDVSAEYVGIEINPVFVQELQEHFPSAHFAQGSAEEMRRFLQQRGHTSCDRVVSGIPWMSLPSEVCAEVIGHVAETITPGGRFVTFSHFPSSFLGRGRAFRTLLESRFSHVRRSDVVVGNLPPAFVYSCVK